MKDKILIIFSGIFFTLIICGVASLFLIHKVRTDSMAPTMPVGSYWLQVPILLPYTPKIGDIVTYECVTQSCFDKHNGENGAQHRITKIDSNGCMTIIGDNPKYDWDSMPCLTPNEVDFLVIIQYLPFVSPR